VVRVVPKLGGDEKLLARNTRLLDGIADSGLSTVDACRVYVSIASLDSGGNSSTIRLAQSLYAEEVVCTVPEHPCPAKCRTQ
jgi:hypothetical protein